jgi:excinuclease ABC subunit A
LAQQSIVIRGARVHNLKNVSVEIPHEKLTVVTGVSGSGKSSLVFDTIYAEGQRRYVESLSAYARQFLDRMEKPDVDEVDGIAPPIAVRQKNTTRNPRSTVGTSTELYDFLRLLYARAGKTYCPECGSLVQRDSVDLVAQAMAKETANRWYVLFPIANQKAGGDLGALRDHLFDLRKRGFNRLYQAGQVFEFSTPESLLDVDFSKPVSILVDRIALDSSGARQRIADATEMAYRESGEVLFETSDLTERRKFSEKFACKKCDRTFAEPEPTLFSFNSPVGACPKCQGFGNVVDYDIDLVIPDPYLPLDQGAVAPWGKPQYTWGWTDFRKDHGAKVQLSVPFVELSEAEKAIVWRGIREFFTEVERKKYKVHVRVFISRYRGYAQCPDCEGSRLRQEALQVRVGGGAAEEKTIAQIGKMNIAQAQDWALRLELMPEQFAIADKVLVEIRQRLKFLYDVGLEYLTLDRLSSTLSGGEAQRIQLATCLGSRLVGAAYVLDEPSIGLHSRDTERLINILKDLRDLGNTIVVVEHDPDVMRAADYILDMGPGAGEMGGKVVFEGTLKKLLKDKSSMTGKYLRGEAQVRRSRVTKEVNRKRILQFEGCRAHNLKNIDVEIPLDRMVTITGVSGSGKSTLVHDVIYKALDAWFNNRPGGNEDDAAQDKRTWRRVLGATLLSGIVLVDQSPIGRTPRSNPVTYIKVFDAIRELFANTREADKRGYTSGHFSFNIPGGRCEVCQGDGTVTVEMQFLADVELLCEECNGTRFKSKVLEVEYRGLNIHEVLQLTVAEGIRFFADTPRVVTKLQVLEDVGLGYLRLGQSATTLSGGEAQRVKLAAHLGASSTQRVLFIFDEPTTGLHFDDIAKLLDAFDRLIKNGASLLIIEHNLDVIRASDWIIDLGPEGGDGGGRIVVDGPPEAIALSKDSHTGRFLRI